MYLISHILAHADDPSLTTWNDLHILAHADDPSLATTNWDDDIRRRLSPHNHRPVISRSPTICRFCSSESFVTSWWPGHPTVSSCDHPISSPPLGSLGGGSEVFGWRGFFNRRSRIMIDCEVSSFLTRTSNSWVIIVVLLQLYYHSRLFSSNNYTPSYISIFTSNPYWPIGCLVLATSAPQSPASFVGHSPKSAHTAPKPARTDTFIINHHGQNDQHQ